MKYINYISVFIISFFSLFFASCNDMEDTYKQFIIERTYTGKPDSIKVKSGRERVELSWLLLSDPKINSYKIIWNNGQDSIVNNVAKTDEVDTVNVILDNLKEDIHYFEIYHYNKEGDSSVRATAVAQSYGDRYENSLLNRLFNYKRNQNDLSFVWTAADDGMLFVELNYTDPVGNMIKRIINNETENDTIRDFPMGISFTYRTAFKPEPLALDTFYTHYNTIFVDSDVIDRQPWDMVLIYTGGANRATGWFTGNHFSPYIALDKKDGTFDWLFDGFLFLEIRDGEKSFFGNHGSIPANKQDWTSYMDKFVAPWVNMSALNDHLEVYKSKSGATTPFEKRKITIGIPEAKEGQKDWGSIDGKVMDFDKEEDRITAYKWFIDLAMDKFNSKNYENLELVAFYWIQEGERIEMTIKEVSNYIHDKQLYFYWIPHLLGADNVNNNWKGLGFDRAYLQPGYYYRTDTDYWRLADASKRVNNYQFAPYVELSEQALKSSNNWGYRLDNTIDVFDIYGFWDSQPMGYYQGHNAMYRLFHSTDIQDRALYDRMAQIIARRQKQK